MSDTSSKPAADHPEDAKPRPEPKNPATEEKRIDSAVEDTFPASDASSEVQPKPTIKEK